MPSHPEVIVLCGGAGSRLRTVTGETPKGMANVAGRPFLELLLQQLKRQEFTRVILAVGYQSECIRSRFGDNISDLQLLYSTELRALGTAGAIRNAADLVMSDNVLVMNGDSYTNVDLRDVVSDYCESEADASVVVVSADDRTDCGFVRLDAARKVSSFDEKQPGSAVRYVNAGIYMLSSDLLRDIPPDHELSLEREVIPGWLKARKNLRGFIHSGICIDIGTPERYRSAQTLLAAVEADRSPARV